MKEKVKYEKGITLIALIVTIIVIIILAGITINVGTKTIQKAKLENLKTNMLLLQGKLKTYVEDAKFQSVTSIDNYKYEEGEDESKFGTKVEENTTIGDKAKKAGITDFTDCYYFTNDQLENMGLKDIQESEGDYIVKYDINNISVDIYYTLGYTHTDGKTYYKITDIEGLE